MAESSLFLAGKLLKPENTKTSSESSSIPEIKTKKAESEPEKPWVGTAALRSLGKRNEERNKASQAKTEGSKVNEVPMVQEVLSVPRYL
jgi:hypothetical protein